MDPVPDTVPASVQEPSAQEPFALAADLRPQAFGSTGPDRVRDPLVEPAWPGQRVLAASAGGRAVLLADGEPIDGHGSLAAALARMLEATSSGAIVDGYLTKQVVADDRAIYTGPDELPSAGRLIAQSMVGVRRNRAEEAAQRLEAEQAARTFAPDDTVNLVLVDLLWLDGEWLLDVPLLERKRLLDAVVPGDELVRAGLYVRPPLPTWIGSWRAQGFTAITYKAANSRYRPGTTNPDWTSSGMPRR
jgi:hypothetical protein